MSHRQYSEITGKNARNSTTRLMQSLQDILRESGADKYIRNGETMPPTSVLPMSPEMAEGQKTLPPPGGAPRAAAPQHVTPARPTMPQRAHLERPVCLDRTQRKGFFGRLFG